MKILLDIPDASLSITKERPDEFARSLRIAAAVKWYELGRISQSKAAELIGCSRIELFNHLLGTLGLLLRAKHLGLINQITTHINRLEEVGANLSPSVITHALKLADETA